MHPTAIDVFIEIKHLVRQAGFGVFSLSDEEEGGQESIFLLGEEIRPLPRNMRGRYFIRSPHASKQGKCCCVVLQSVDKKGQETEYARYTYWERTGKWDASLYQPILEYMGAVHGTLSGEDVLASIQGCLNDWCALWVSESTQGAFKN